MPVGVTSPAVIPLIYRNLTGLSQTVGRAALSGAAADYRIVGDTCSTRRLAPRADSQIVVAFTPSTAGTRAASLALKIGATTLRTPLTGIGSPGRTVLSMTSEAGEWVGKGQRYLITDAQYPIHAGNGPRDRTSATLLVRNGTDIISVQIGLVGGLRTGTFTTGSKAGDLRVDVTANASACAHLPAPPPSTRSNSTKPTPCAASTSPVDASAAGSRIILVSCTNRSLDARAR